MSNEENLQAYDVNISKHEDVTEDIPMEETSLDESTTKDESTTEDESVNCLLPILSVREDAYSTKACSVSSMLRQSKMSFHQALDLIFELDEGVVGCTRDISRQSDYLDRLSEIPWVVPTFVVIEGEIEILGDVVETSGYRCEVLRSSPVERIKQGNE
ncbi:hypothetical protein Tco_0290026 [Tanacetum coccineum]